ncbi:MAG: polyamine ABC transporter permease [Candidatus Pelagibacter sp. TMED64]|nr:polyamine ABC transporter permease [Candidatus Pelagibacter sp.]OUU67607.1 MAG: polyamine ABC transporter permease [Candidatus Pelagibacter sp. TMED64]|tara:strand:- start:3439 stop:4323 length:885 start_codon:yes stop_codon:yes gene_type:complete
MALPAYASTGQKVSYYTYLTYCGLVFFFLIAPIFIILPLSFSSSPFFEFTREFMNFESEAWSLRWYRQMVGISSPGDTTVVSNKWMLGTRNSFIIGISATFLATALGTVAALGLSRPNMPFKGVLMAILISPMIVPLIITSAGMFFFYSKIGLTHTYLGLILAHTALGTPFVVITVTATLTGFDTNLIRASQSLGANTIRTFFKVIMPLILPGVISGGLFAFITSFDEVVVVMFVGSVEQITIPKQMWAGLRQETSPVILCMATCLVFLSIALLTTVELLRRRSERLRGIKLQN